MADLARRELERRTGATALLVFVPAARSPHKDRAPTATDAQRVEMLELATADLVRCTVWTDEIDRAVHGEPSYWLTTVRRAHRLAGGRSLAFAIGADQAASFHRWREPREILDIARVLVLPREPLATAIQLRDALSSTGFWQQRELDRWVESFVDVEACNAASTEVRRAGGSAFDTPLHPRVLDYARANKLYGLH